MAHNRLEMEVCWLSRFAWGNLLVEAATGEGTSFGLRVGVNVPVVSSVDTVGLRLVHLPVAVLFHPLVAIRDPVPV